MGFPDITTLQFLVLAVLIDGELAGRPLREELDKRGYRKSAPAFYQSMARLEEAGLVEGRYEPKMVHGQRINERIYKVTGEGIRAVGEFEGFVRSNAAGRLGLLGG
jgi:DNA-binding PadR family transcriptional regulator